MIIKGLQRFMKSGNSYALAANISNAVFGFASFWILVRILDANLFGQWVLFLTTTSLLDMFRVGLTGTAAIRLLSKEKKEKDHIIAASYQLALFTSLLMGIILFVMGMLLKHINGDNLFAPIFILYPLVALANLPLNQALTNAQGGINFKEFFSNRLISSGIIFLAVMSYLISTNNYSFQAMALCFIAGNAMASFLLILLKRDGLKYIFLKARDMRKKILKFGKFSTASYIGSNLLRSSDTLILGMAPFMGTEAIAILAIPFKFIELVEIPLRSFSATAFPRLSQSLDKTKENFKNILFSYTSVSVAMVIPMIVFLLSFPVFFLHLLGGENYAGHTRLQEQIIWIVAAYIFLLPIDRYTGVALFALDKPKQNFYKILFMLIANIVLDIIAVFVFQSLLLVALATLIFTLLGLFLGWRFVFAELSMNLNTVLKHLWKKVKPYIKLNKLYLKFS